MDSAICIDTDNPDIAVVMPQIARRIDHRGVHGGGAVLHHQAAFAPDQPNGQPGVIILAAGDTIESVVGKKIRPRVDILRIENSRIFRIEFFDIETQRAGFIGGQVGPWLLFGRHLKYPSPDDSADRAPAPTPRRSAFRCCLPFPAPASRCPHHYGNV